MASGMDLKVLRIRYRVKQQELAEAMGITRQRLWEIEQKATVPTAGENRYMEALAKLVGEAA